MAESMNELSYATDEQTAGYVRIILGIKGLRTTKKLVMKGVLPKFETVAENAEVTATFENRSFDFKVSGTKNLKDKTYYLTIRQLPGDISPDDCYYEIEKNRIVLFLCKLEKKSWDSELRNGLETLE